MNYLISDEIKKLLTPLSESPLIREPHGNYLSEAEDEDADVGEDDDESIDGDNTDEEEDQEDNSTSTDDSESTNTDGSDQEIAGSTETDPNSDVSIYGDLKSERMLNMYRACCEIYDILDDTKRTVIVLMKRPEFFMAANRINQELDVVIPELKQVIDSDFNPSKEKVYSNILVKFNAYVKALRIVFADIENQIKSNDH